MSSMRLARGRACLPSNSRFPKAACPLVLNRNAGEREVSIDRAKKTDVLFSPVARPARQMRRLARRPAQASLTGCVQCQ